jgi:prevent-host-death family protein
MRSMPVQGAEAALADVVDRASRGEPTLLKRDGEAVAVVVGFDEWQRLTAARRPLANLRLSLPGDVDLGRDPAAARDPLRERG